MEEHQPSKSTVPKFASFKPKTPLPVSQPTEPSPPPSESEKQRRHRHREHDEHRERDRERDRERNREKYHERSRHRHPKYSRREDHERRHRDVDRHEDHHRQHRRRTDSRTRHDGEEKKSNNALVEPLIQEWDEDKNYFCVDRKGDQANLVYGKLHQYSIPAYRRVGYGSVVGLPSDYKIDKLASDDRYIVVDDNRRHGRLERHLLSKYLRGKEPPTLRLIKPPETGVDPIQELDLDFIPTQSSRKRKRESESPEREEEQVDYRSIEGKAKPSTKPADTDLEYASDGDSTQFQDYLAEAKERNAILSRKVKAEPTNLQAWLDFIKHQEVMIRIGASDFQRHLTASEQKALASLRLDIYQEALGSIQSDILLIGLMDESSKVYEKKEYFARWKQVLEKNQQSAGLWIKYLDAIQTNLAEFHYEDSKSKFLECLKVLCGTDLNSTDAQKLRLYIFLRLTTLMRDSGYRERAIALWQALLEFQLSRPKKGIENDVDYNRSLLLDFEEFWESECPRLGEPGSLGWAASRDDNTYPDPPKSITMEEDEIMADEVFEYFAQKERRQMSSHPWPGRTTDEAGEEDPFHVVLFTDIEEELGLLQDPLPPTMLVEALLCFWHLPPLPISDNTRSWWLDPFLRDEKLRSEISPVPLLEGLSSKTDETEHSTLDTYKPPMAHFQVTTQELFNGDFFASEHTPDEQEWLRRSLKTLASVVLDDVIAEYYLAFEWHYNPSGAAKTAKSLLKKRSSSLRLYNAYALMESRSGKGAAANHVVTMALGMSTQLPQEAGKYSILLWRTWIWEALRAEDLTAARHRISSLGEMKPEPEPRTSIADEATTFSPAIVLKVRNVLTEGRDHSLSTGDIKLATLYSECLALLAYVQNNSDITAASQVFHQTSTLLASRNLLSSPAHESLHQAKCQLLNYHARRTRLFKPSVIRSELQESILLFPNNTIFLATYAANEARFRIDDRVRAIMQDVVLKKEEQSIVGWYFSVYAELQRGEHLGGTTYAVRAAFEKAVDSDIGKKSAALWSSYVLYLCSRSDHAAAKQVFFRGLLHLPFSKPYIMLAFEHLRHTLSFQELRRVYNTLQEKELRVHVELDEMLQEIDARAEEKRKRLEEQRSRR